MAPRDWAGLAALTVLWGIVFLFYDLSISGGSGTGFGPLTAVLIRVGGAALALLLFMAATRRSLGNVRANARHYLFIGFFTAALPFTFFAWGQAYIASGLAAVINAFTPLPTLLLAVAIRQERITPLKIAGIAAGITGVGLLVLPSVNSDPLEFAGGLVILGAPLCYAVGANYARRHLNSGTPLQNTTGVLTAGTLALIPCALILPALPISNVQTLFGNPVWHMPAGYLPWIGVIGLALPSTAVAFPIFFWLIRHAGATNTVMVTLLVPVLAVTIGILVLDEMFNATFFAGTALVMLALLLVDGQLLRRIAHWAADQRRRG